MQQYFQMVTDYIVAHKKVVIICAASVVAVGFLIALIGWNIWLSMPKYDFQPAKACAMFTPAKAENLMNQQKVIAVDTKTPIVAGNTVTSKCSYTNSDINNMIVAALAVRSAFNNKGVAKNKADFVAKKPHDNVEDVKGVGDQAYFNHELGQLNVLKGHDWLIISYGIGSAPEANKVDDAVKLAHIVLK